MDKPTKPTDLMPRTFGGLKENYSTSLQQTGVEPNVPVIYHGKNFNYEKNAIGQELDYCEKICDYINAIPIGKTITTDANNKLVYVDASDSGKANVDLDNITQTGEQVITDLITETTADRNLSNLFADGNARLHALKGYSDEGELLTDSEGLEDVTNYAHSTFDLTKFTVVGSPTVTSDGVVSDFSNSNFLTSTIPALTNNNSFTISGRFFNGQFSGLNRTVFNFSGWDTNMGQARTDGVYLSWAGVSVPTLYISNANDIWLDFIFEYVANTKITLKIKKSTDEAYTLTSEASMSGVTFSYTDFAVGAWLNGNNAFRYGSIDLKQFSITVDGVEVFSGNKTGIDTVKPDDYTVVGTPTISADGIASGISSSNNITKTSFEFLGNTLVVQGEYTWNGTTPTGSTGIFELYNTSNFVRLFQANNGKLELYTKISDTEYYDFGRFDISANISFKYTVTLTSSSLNITGYQNSTKVVDKTITTNIPAISNLTNFKLSNFSTTTQGSIDLNAFKFYVDGNLVYQPCLKIPYTESKTGSKIVQSVYRDRVSDMYEQFGYAPYYTLDEDNGNFTLPMGEIYGMLERKADDNEIAAINTRINSLPQEVIYDTGWQTCAANTNYTFNLGGHAIAGISADRYTTSVLVKYLENVGTGNDQIAAGSILYAGFNDMSGGAVAYNYGFALYINGSTLTLHTGTVFEPFTPNSPTWSQIQVKVVVKAMEVN